MTPGAGQPEYIGIVGEDHEQPVVIDAEKNEDIGFVGPPELPKTEIIDRGKNRSP